MYGLNMVKLDLGVWKRQGRCRRGAGDEPLVYFRHWARYLPAVISSNSHRTEVYIIHRIVERNTSEVVHPKST